MSLGVHATHGTLDGMSHGTLDCMSHGTLDCMSHGTLDCMSHGTLDCMSDGEGEGVWWDQSNSYLRQQKDIKRLGRPRLRKVGVIFQF